MIRSKKHHALYYSSVRKSTAINVFLLFNILYNVVLLCIVQYYNNTCHCNVLTG